MFSWVEPATYLLAIGIFVGTGAIVWFLWHHSRWRGSVDTDRSGFKEFMAEIRDDINKILERLRGLETRLDLHLSAVADSHSPIRLNALGTKVSAEIGAKDWAGRVADGLRDRIQEMDAYEIQEFCFAYVEAVEYSDAERRANRKSADENGIATHEVRRVMALELRDRLLALSSLDPPEV